MSLSYVWLFIFLLCAGMPVVFAMLVGPGLSLLFDGESEFFTLLLSRLYNGIDSFPLMAVPFFILAGELMNAGGITQSLVRFSQSMIGHVRGGLAHVNILSSILFAGMSGSAVADTSALGKLFVPAMEKAGYSRPFAAAITAASSVIGPIIPPSGIMILYAFIMNVSVAGLFAAGLVPGLLMGLVLMVLTSRLARRLNLPEAQTRSSWRERRTAFKQTFLALLTPVLLLGGILSGVFTPTEAAAIAATYALLISVLILRSVGGRDLPSIFVNTAVQSGVILLLVGAAVAFAWVVTVSGLADILTQRMLQLTDNVYLLLLLINLFLLFVGMFLDAGPAILILGPILAPMAIEMGVDPLHFAIIMCVNVTVGLATPPMGLVLLVAASVSGERMELIVRSMWPFLLAQIGIILLITFVPAIALTLPRLLGFA